MSQQIRTKWHKILPLIEADEVYLTSVKNQMAQNGLDFQPNLPLTKKFIGQLAALPKFVIADQLLALTEQENFQQSLLDMKKAGVLRLPYPALVVEFNLVLSQGAPARAIVMLRDNKSEGTFPWEPSTLPKAEETLHQQDVYGCVFRIENDGSGDYLVLSPGIVAMSVAENEGAPWLRIWCDHHNLLTYSPELNSLLGATYAKDSSVLWRALSCALLIMNTEGVKREVIDCNRVNRTRGGKTGKPLIPSHTYINIGRVYRSSEGGESEEYTERSFTPRWRRGYLQPVRFGKGWTQRRLDYIPPRWIDAKSVEPSEPGQAKEYHVNR